MLGILAANNSILAQTEGSPTSILKTRVAWRRMRCKGYTTV